MTLEKQTQAMLPALEAELRRQIDRIRASGMRPFHDMLEYHMGWTGSSSATQAGGKRIRPLLLLLVCKSVGGRWRNALPAAAAIEITHNFSLVHDDIQDNSPTRRGRPALWKIHGAGLAINAGDALLTIANQAALDLEQHHPAATVLKASAILHGACLDLTRGQFLDLYHQRSNSLSLASYWEMIEGKTAALIAAAAEMGALLGQAKPLIRRDYREFGRLLGMAFQVQDDILGTWGDETVTGKPAAGDLAEGKLSLPVVYGLRKKGRFAHKWGATRRRKSEAAVLRSLLEEEGAYAQSVRQAQRLTSAALQTLERLRPAGSAGAALIELTRQLLGRER